MHSHGQQKRHELISQHLFSVFKKPTTTFTEDIDETYKQRVNIYDENLSRTYIHLWTDYKDSFSLDEVQNAIASIKLKSEPGPMGLTAASIRYNGDLLASHIHMQSIGIRNLPRALEAFVSNSHSKEG